MKSIRFSLLVTQSVLIGSVQIASAGSHIADSLAGLDEGRQAPPVLMLGTPVSDVPQGKPAQIHIDGPLSTTSTAFHRRSSA